jgi:hypothetical protein
LFPKIDHPIFTVRLPAEDREVRFRPFLSKEERMLLMAMESNDTKTMTNAIKQLITNCAIDEIDVDNMATIDIEVFFLNLRARSIGEKTEQNFTCNIVHDGEPCGGKFTLEIDLLKVSTTNINVDRVIMLNDKIGLKMKYPVFSLAEMIKPENEDLVYDFVVGCIDSIFSDNTVQKVTDENKDDAKLFLDSLTRPMMYKIEKFFEKIPTLSYKETIECPKCQTKHKIEVEGLSNFF